MHSCTQTDKLFWEKLIRTSFFLRSRNVSKALMYLRRFSWKKNENCSFWRGKIPNAVLTLWPKKSRQICPWASTTDPRAWEKNTQKEVKRPFSGIDFSERKINHSNSNSKTKSDKHAVGNDRTYQSDSSWWQKITLLRIGLATPRIDCICVEKLSLRLADVIETTLHPTGATQISLCGWLMSSRQHYSQLVPHKYLYAVGWCHRDNITANWCHTNISMRLADVIETSLHPTGATQISLMVNDNESTIPSARLARPSALRLFSGRPRRNAAWLPTSWTSYRLHPGTRKIIQNTNINLYTQYWCAVLNQTINRPTNQPINQSNNQWRKRSINQSINDAKDPSINWSKEKNEYYYCNQSINQSRDQANVLRFMLWPAENLSSNSPLRFSRVFPRPFWSVNTPCCRRRRSVVTPDRGPCRCRKSKSHITNTIRKIQ